MDSSGDNDEQFEDGEYIFYKDRPEWKDVTPIPQDDGEQPVVKIAYSDKFRDVYDYFRGIMKIAEKSERALELTKDALELNPANYTVWQYRREILFALNKDLWEELEYIKQMAIENPKNYQIWHHRRVIVEKLNDASSELEVTAALLEQDSKNYHAWQHRQWAIKTYKLYEFELDYIDELLEKDLRNNSAWTQRNFVIQNTTGFTKEVLDREVSYTLSKIENAKDNESAWNYLRGLLLHEEAGLIKNKVVTDFCENLYKNGNRSPFLLAFIVDICDEFQRRQTTDKWFTIELALQICHDLAEEHDPIRKSYWEHIAETLTKKEGDESSEQNESTTT